MEPGSPGVSSQVASPELEYLTDHEEDELVVHEDSIGAPSGSTMGGAQDDSSNPTIPVLIGESKAEELEGDALENSEQSDSGDDEYEYVTAAQLCEELEGNLDEVAASTDPILRADFIETYDLFVRAVSEYSSRLCSNHRAATSGRQGPGRPSSETSQVERLQMYVFTLTSRIQEALGANAIKLPDHFL